jgi:hypothetical protein
MYIYFYLSGNDRFALIENLFLTETNSHIDHVSRLLADFDFKPPVRSNHRL